MFEDLRKMLAGVSADYADLRHEVKRETKIAFNGRELTLLTSNATDGYVFRVLKGGGMATVAFTKAADAEKAARTAEENAQLVGKREGEPVRFAPTEKVIDTYLPQLDRDPRRIPLEEKLELARHYNEIPLQAGKVATTETAYEEIIREKRFISTEGSEVREDLAMVRVSGAVISQDGSLTQRVRFGFGGSSGYARVLQREKEVEELTGVAVDLLKAKPVSAGNYRAVLNQRLTGVFTHEAFGHFSEADLIEDSPTMREKMQIGAKLGTDVLNIKDDPTQLNQLGHFKYDDEGVRARPTQLMKGGVLVGRLHSRRTAAGFNEPLSGHCVAEDFHYAPIIRMGCIYIEPASLSLDDLLARLDDGLYLLNPMGGQTAGENFSFAASWGFEVKGGRKMGMIRDINLTGNLYRTLQSISAIGNDLKLGEIGGCGKGQTNLRSCYGGPHIMVDSVVIGGR